MGVAAQVLATVAIIALLILGILLLTFGPALQVCLYKIKKWIERDQRIIEAQKRIEQERRIDEKNRRDAEEEINQSVF